MFSESVSELQALGIARQFFECRVACAVGTLFVEDHGAGCGGGDRPCGTGSLLSSTDQKWRYAEVLRRFLNGQFGMPRCRRTRSTTATTAAATGVLATALPGQMQADALGEAEDAAAAAQLALERGREAGDRLAAVDIELAEELSFVAHRLRIAGDRGYDGAAGDRDVVIDERRQRGLDRGAAPGKCGAEAAAARRRTALLSLCPRAWPASFPMVRGSRISR